MTPQEKLAQQVESLESLSVIDAEIKKLDARIGEEQLLLESRRKELAFLDDKLGQNKTSVGEMHKTMGELSVEVRQMAAQIDRSREKLSRARNERENVAAEREMDELRKLLRDREDEVGKLNSLADSAKKTIADVEIQRAKIYLELSSSESELSSSIVAVTAERETRIADRSEISKKVPNMTLRRYEAIRKKRGMGIAKATDGTCQACYVALPPQLFQRVQRCEALEECPMCHTLIYWAPAASAEPG